MDALTVVSDVANIQNAPGVRKANSELHSVGLGAMNLHGYLAKNKIGYESEETKILNIHYDEFLLNRTFNGNR